MTGVCAANLREPHKDERLLIDPGSRWVVWTILVDRMCQQKETHFPTKSGCTYSTILQWDLLKNLPRKQRKKPNYLLLEINRFQSFFAFTNLDQQVLLLRNHLHQVLKGILYGCFAILPEGCCLFNCVANGEIKKKHVLQTYWHWPATSQH